MLTLLLISMIWLVFDIQRTEASGTIYIRADGSIEPSTAPISTVDKITYTLTGNIYDSIVVERDSITINGAGHILQGTGSGKGIDLTGRNKVTIKNLKIAKFYYGIYLYGSVNIAIANSNVTSNEADGVYLLNSDTNTISGNVFTSNKRYGIAFSEAGNNAIFHNNFINNTDHTHVYLSFNNIWDNGYPSGGNHWDNYTGVDLYSGPYQNESGSDGIGDIEYAVNANNTDRYPLMKTWTPLIGDVNRDGKVDIKDLVLLIKAFGTYPGKPKWNPNADLNTDGKVDIKDLVLIIKHFGEH
jgi:parallel beta-helix repeat protein